MTPLPDPEAEAFFDAELKAQLAEDAPHVTKTQRIVANMSPEEKDDLVCRFDQYVADGQDNRRAALSIHEVELLIAIADERGESHKPLD
jgi:hypothetical protein